MAGIAFRNPNAFEQFYDDQGVSQMPNPLLRPERIQSFEGALERQIAARLNAVATVYQYWLRDLIEAIPVGDGLVQYQNVSRYNAKGVEFELNGHAWKGLEGAASVALEDLNKTSATARVAAQFAQSPRQTPTGRSLGPRPVLDQRRLSNDEHAADSRGLSRSDRFT